MRCVALMLLMFAAVDLFAIDVFYPDLCDSPFTNTSDNQNSSDQDDCFCCCGHIVFSAPPQLGTLRSTPSDDPPVKAQSISREPASIYRPPRA